MSPPLARLELTAGTDHTTRLGATWPAGRSNRRKLVDFDGLKLVGCLHPRTLLILRTRWRRQIECIAR